MLNTIVPWSTLIQSYKTCQSPNTEWVILMSLNFFCENFSHRYLNELRADDAIQLFSRILDPNTYCIHGTPSSDQYSAKGLKCFDTKNVCNNNKPVLLWGVISLSFKNTNRENTLRKFEESDPKVYIFENYYVITTKCMDAAPWMLQTYRHIFLHVPLAVDGW